MSNYGRVKRVEIEKLWFKIEINKSLMICNSILDYLLQAKALYYTNCY